MMDNWRTEQDYRHGVFNQGIIARLSYIGVAYQLGAIALAIGMHSTHHTNMLATGFMAFAILALGKLNADVLFAERKIRKGADAKYPWGTFVLYLFLSCAA